MNQAGNSICIALRRSRAEFHWEFRPKSYTISPWDIDKGKMSHIDKEKQNLVARIKRIRRQVDSIERSLTTGDDCADVLMLLANIRGGINSLMAEVLEDHIRHHLLSPERSSAPPHELAEDMIDLV